MMSQRLIGSVLLLAMLGVALLALAGCGATAPTPPPKPNLPALPVTATTACVRPVAKIGADLGVAAGAGVDHVGTVRGQGRRAVRELRRQGVIIARSH